MKDTKGLMYVRHDRHLTMVFDVITGNCWERKKRRCSSTKTPVKTRTQTRLFHVQENVCASKPSDMHTQQVEQLSLSTKASHTDKKNSQELTKEPVSQENNVGTCQLASRTSSKGTAHREEEPCCLLSVCPGSRQGRLLHGWQSSPSRREQKSVTQKTHLYA